MDKFDYIKECEAQTRSINRFLKTLKLGDGSKVVLPKTPSDPRPHPRSGYYEEQDAIKKAFMEKERNRAKKNLNRCSMATTSIICGIIFFIVVLSGIGYTVYRTIKMK